MNAILKFTIFGSVLWCAASENITEIVKNSSVTTDVISNSSTTRTQNARALYGVLGFLTGYRLGQALGPTSYNSDIRESGQVNLFAKLFNNALYLTYQKYPHPYAFMPFPPMYNPPHTFHPLSENSYPPNIQPPIWYPPIINPIVLPAGHNPVNQQQIINLHEPFNPEEAPNENYQELNDHNSQEIHNNFHTGVKPNDDAGPIETLDSKLFSNGKITNSSQSKNKVLFNCEVSNSCLEAIEAEVTTIDSNTAVNSSTTEDNTSTTEISITASDAINSTESGNTVTTTESQNPIKETNETSILGDQMITAGPPTLLPGPVIVANGDSVHNSTPNSTNNHFHPVPSDAQSKYPYPIYHFYGNLSKYEHVSITEGPNNSEMRQFDYYEEPSSFGNDYLPLPDDGMKLPFAAAPRLSEASGNLENNRNKEIDPNSLNFIGGAFNIGTNLPHTATPQSSEVLNIKETEPNSFRPMGGSYYDSGRAYQTPGDKFNVNQDDSGFVPLKTNDFL